MKKKILRLISSALTCAVIAGGSIACPLNAQAEENYVTGYDYITGLFSDDVCNSVFDWFAFLKFPTYTLYIKKDSDAAKMTGVDMRTAVLYVSSDNDCVSELVRDFNPNKVVVDYDVLTDELVEQLGVNMYGRDVEEIIEKAREEKYYDIDFEMNETSVELWRMGQCPRSSFSDIELGSGEFAFEKEGYNNIKGVTACFLFADYTGIASGYSDGSFRPKAYITKEDAAVLVYKMLQSPYFMKDGNNNIAGFELPEPNRELLKGYADGDSVSEYARDAVSVLIQLNFIAPENNCLNPKAFATTSYVDKIYTDLNSFLKTYEISNWYYLDSDPNHTSFINWDRRAKIYGEANPEKLKRKVD